MKSPLLYLVSFLLILSSCGDDDKDRDTIPPNVTLNGNATDYVALNTAYPDPGATATDQADGNVGVTSNYSSSNPNVDSAGTYVIDYTAKDNNGNKGHAYRTVIVSNDASQFGGTYLVTSINGNDTTVYTQNITIDSHLNNTIHFSDLGNYTNNSRVYAIIDSTGVNIPLQHVINIGSNNGQPCDVVNHSFHSSSSTLNANGFTITYTDVVTIPSSCAVNDTIVANFVKQ